MLKRIYLNNDWDFFDGTTSLKVSLPHTIKEIPFNYFDEEMFQIKATYSKTINLDDDFNKNLFLTFEGVGQSCEIYLNDKLITKHYGGYDKFYVNLKDFIQKGENKLKVIVDAKEDPNIPPFGKVVDYLCYGGIYRDVYIDVLNDNYIENVFIKPVYDNSWEALINVSIKSLAKYEINIFYKNELIEKKLINPKELSQDNLFEFKNPKLWDLDNPNLYDVKINLLNDNNEIIDEYQDKFGLRTAIFKKDGFYLNGKKIRIIGLNRHQSYPYVGYAMPKSIQEEDALILKYELGVNAVRTSHYMQSKYFIDECDRIGLLVFTESPGWQHIGDDNWKNLALEFMKKMVIDYRNHPSIILWGARINESHDDHDFYTKSNNLIHSLDPTRQTGGVRCYQKGEELEDVYTYNDFVPEYENYRLTPKKNVTISEDIPYLVSEYNGHMYPTKSFDDELHLEHQALNIAGGLNDLFSDDTRAGMFAWCMFDYNTHKDFGSGDKICYHGILDMYRNKKPAAYLYSSINNIDTLYSTSLMNHGDYPASNIYEVNVFTNADSIKLYKNDEFIREFNHKDTKYKNLPNAPITIDDFVGELLITKEGYTKKVSDKMKAVLKAFLLYGNNMPFNIKLKYLNLVLFHHVTFEKGYELYGKYIGGWGDKETIYKIEAIKNNKVIKTLCLGDSKSIHLDVKIFNHILHEENTYDARSIRLKVLDQNDNLAQYYQEAFELSSTGPIEIIGPKLLSFKGGMCGTYIKTKHEKGTAKLIIKTQFETKEIEFEIK